MKIKIEKVIIIEVPLKDKKKALDFAKEYAKRRCARNEFITKVSTIEAGR